MIVLLSCSAARPRPPRQSLGGSAPREVSAEYAARHPYARLLRELTAVTETGTADDVIWARQAIDALAELNQAAGSARAAIDAEVLGKHGRWFRDAADAGIILNAARRSKLQRKRHALATRMRDRAAAPSHSWCATGPLIGI
jgi:hypothetical protein